MIRTKRRAYAASTQTKRLKYDNVETEATNRSVPGDLDFYIDDDGRLETLEIGSIPNEPTTPESSVRVARPLAQSNHDQYCWVCHTNKTTKFCETCIRSFHIQCLHQNKVGKPFTDSLEHWRCPLCKELRNGKNDFQRRQVDLVKFNELLKFIVDRLYNDEELKKFGTAFNNVLRSVSGVAIINPIDLNLIEEKVIDAKYESTIEFIVDIKWILHNCGIAFKENKSISSQAKRMLRFCERELYDIEICPECYSRSNTYIDNNWFVNPCKQPHLLVWAKLKGNHEPYWPAKAVALKNGMVDVRFFGDHACAFVPSANVFLYSKENPNKRMSAPNQSFLNRYIQEVDEYIANLNDKFSLFKCMPPMMNFEPDKIYIHLHQMLPYLYIDENFEYFRKMKDFIRREEKQPAKLSLGYSPEGASFGLRPLSVLMHRMKRSSVANNENDDEADVNDLADSIVNTMNIKTEPDISKKIIYSQSDRNMVECSMIESEKDEDETEVTMIEVVSIPETDKEQAGINNESQSSTSDRSDNQNSINTIVPLLSSPENNELTQSSKINEQSEEPPKNVSNLSMPSLSTMSIIDETDESVPHEKNPITSQSISIMLNESLPNTVATNTALDDDEDWREIKLLVAKKMKKDHQLEQQLYQETLNAAKKKLIKLQEKNKVLEKENEHWKMQLRDVNTKMRENTADFKKQLEEKEEIIKRLEIEYAVKIEKVKTELNEQWRNKKWCTNCGNEIRTQFLNSEFCGFSCMRQSWVQHPSNLIQTNNNDEEININEID